jgi:hypothetical protein
MTKPAYLLNAFRKTCFCVLLAGLSACSADQKRSELGRQVSPNQKLVAVLTETLVGGAQEGLNEDIYLGDQGIPFKLDNPVFTASGCNGLSLSWLNDYTMEIRYPSTCSINSFTNRWYRPSDLEVGRRNPIELILVRS